MKKSLALLCLLALGVLVGCGEKPKPVAPSGPNKAVEGMAEQGKKAMEEDAAKEAAGNK